MLLKKKEPALTRRGTALDPFTTLRQMTTEFDRLFPDAFFRWPLRDFDPQVEAGTFIPEIDVFEKDGRLVTKIDLPGLKKEDVKVEINEGLLVISGVRTTEAEDKKEGFYRCERAYGSFYRTVPLPEGVKADNVKATFLDGVLEVSVPMPVQAAPVAQKIEIGDAPPKAEKSAA